MNMAHAMVELTHRNTRRYGGYLVHMGIVFMFMGFTGAAFDKDVTAEVNMGDSIRLGHYDLRVADLHEGENENYSWHRALITGQIQKTASRWGPWRPERRFYKASRQGLGEIGLCDRG